MTDGIAVGVLAVGELTKQQEPPRDVKHYVLGIQKKNRQPR